MKLSALNEARQSLIEIPAELLHVSKSKNKEFDTFLKNKIGPLADISGDEITFSVRTDTLISDDPREEGALTKYYTLEMYGKNANRIHTVNIFEKLGRFFIDKNTLADELTAFKSKYGISQARAAGWGLEEERFSLIRIPAELLERGREPDLESFLKNELGPLMDIAYPTVRLSGGISKEKDRGTIQIIDPEKGMMSVPIIVRKGRFYVNRDKVVDLLSGTYFNKSFKGWGNLKEERLSVIEIPSEFFGRRYWEYTTEHITKELGPIVDMCDPDLIFYADSNYITNGPMLFLDNSAISYSINLKQKGKRFYVSRNELVDRAVSWFGLRRHIST